MKKCAKMESQRALTVLTKRSISLLALRTLRASYASFIHHFLWFLKGFYRNKGLEEVLVLFLGDTAILDTNLRV